MYIKNIKIKNFRNINECNINPGEKINFIFGENAQGKTNLIETIYYSSFFKSFRTNKNINLINIEKENLFIDINITNNRVNNNLKISLDNNKNKKIIINNKNSSNEKFYNIINSIVYYPDEIIYLKNYPAYRRNLIDRSIFYINNDYINLFRKYIKCLKQRNIFLKSPYKEHDIWKDKLIEYSYSIIVERINYLKRINEYFDILYKKNNEYEKYSIEYCKYDTEKLKDDLFQKFERYKTKEIKYGYTLVGPHLDDFIFLINNNNIGKYSSEGQKRSLLLNYKQAQLQDYKDNYGYYPILLFDDMGSELDSSRKHNIFNKILDNSGQVFITTMDIPPIDKSNTKIFEVKNGEFTEFLFN
ncbi:MAG: DNA replication and repair protein RecF [Desulfuromusa sp.]|jgi:DNA replication and repair protein RecF|nr:DNA replication and repair protein RecF [Desulfuromusa sp.]